LAWAAALALISGEAHAASSAVAMKAVVEKAVRLREAALADVTVEFGWLSLHNPAVGSVELRVSYTPMITTADAQFPRQLVAGRLQRQGRAMRYEEYRGDANAFGFVPSRYIWVWDDGHQRRCVEADLRRGSISGSVDEGKAIVGIENTALLLVSPQCCQLPLSAYLADANTKVEVALRDGRILWRVGNEHLAVSAGAAWLDPALGFAPVRIEHEWRQPDGRFVRATDVYSDFQEVKDGVWLPTRALGSTGWVAAPGLDPPRYTWLTGALFRLAPVAAPATAPLRDGMPDLPVGAVSFSDGISQGARFNLQGIGLDLAAEKLPWGFTWEQLAAP
jgi:hypothetical protein